jgi:hypothetical protein
MPDNLKNTGQQDDERINVNQPWELRDWAKKLKISKEKLIEVVKQVGPMVKDVKKFLGQ